MNKVLLGITLLFYFVGTFHYLLFLINQRAGIGKVCRVATIAGFGFHTATIISYMLTRGQAPITTVHESLVFFSWAIVFIYIILEYKYKITVMGAFVIPLAFSSMVLSLNYPILKTPVPAYFRSAWLMVHTTFAFLGDAAFAIAFGIGLMYLIQERQLKKKKPGLLYRRLPSLDILDELNYKSIAIGFPLLTLAIVTGSVWSNSLRGEYWSWDPKEIWSLITWMIYAAYLHARLISGWRGRKAAYLAIIGFLLVIFTFLGVNFLLPSTWHEFEGPGGMPR